jgi:alcohol dehydrogenase class IV
MHDPGLQRPARPPVVENRGGAQEAVGNYDLTLPPVVRFGWGRLLELAEVVAALGSRGVFVVGRTSFIESGAEALVADVMRRAGIDWQVVASSVSEPTVEDTARVTSGLAACDLAGAVVVAVGGGATIDLAKAAAALAANVDPTRKPADRAAWNTFVVDHLEGVGKGLQIQRPPPPLVAVPTTAGTGAEATRNAVISCPQRGFKKSLRSPLMVPRAVIVDPQLTLSSPPRVAAASGLDAITQLVESFVCRRATPFTRAIAQSAIPGAMQALPVVVAAAGKQVGKVSSSGAEVHRCSSLAVVGGAGRAAREAMSHAALLSGIALANSGLGMAHGVAAALGVVCGVSHGEACSVMLPAAVRVNLECQGRRYAELERLMAPDAGRDDRTAAAAFLDRVERLCEAVGSPRRLSELGVTSSMLPRIAELSGGNSMRGNPLEMTTESVLQVLQSML